MLIHRIFHKPRIKNRNPRGRRFLSETCLRLEPLENRTPLSSGLGAAALAPLVSRPVEIGTFIPEPPLVLESHLLGAIGFDQATPTGPAEIALTNGSSSASPGIIVASFKSRVTFLDAIDPGGEIEMASFPQPPGPSIPMGPAPGRGKAQTNSNDDQATDMSYAGSLESIEMEDGLSTWTAAQAATGRGTGHALSFVVTDPSLQPDAMSDIPGTSGLSYMATGGGSTLYSPTSSGDDALTWDDGSTEPISPAGITIGGVSLNVLLSGPDERAQTEPGGVEQVAELVPLPESSLALAATLWTVPSDSPGAPARWDAPTRTTIDPDARNTLASSWVLFVTGMDQALEQTSRDIRDGTLSPDGRHSTNEGPPAARDELIEWQGPILPAAHGRSPERKPKLPRTSPGAKVDEAGQGTLRTRQGSRQHSDDGQPVVLGVMPIVSAVSISTLVAGWLWRKRGQLHRKKDTSRRTPLSS